VAALAGGVYWLRVRRIRERAEELARLVDERTKALQAARDTLERRVGERTSQLAEELAERKRLQYQLVQSQKLESIGRLAGGVAHEINNMMTGVLGFAEMAEAQAKDQPSILEDLKQITVAGQRVAQITRQLLTFARRQASKRSAVDVGELIRSLERFLLRVVGENVELGIELAPEIPRINADASQVEQLIVNLVMNGRDAITNRGKITIQVKGATFNEVRQIGTFELLPGDYVVITVADSGVGIAADARSRLFEPFFTTKDVNRGAGLGLAVCYGIVTQHAGAIAVDSEVGSGSRFDVYLPTGVVVEEAVVTPTEERIPKGTERVLVVEDEASVRQVATRTLRHLGYDVIEAIDGLDALERCGDDLGRLALVLTDVVMPRLGGIDLARTLRDRRSDLPIVFMSGYAGKDSPWDSGVATLGPLLEKPFTRAALAAVVRREIDRLKGAPARV
jgi:signal transduction histidine kinase/CheY-like chemotaxis protein